MFSRQLLRKLYITSQPVGSAPPANEYLQVIGNRTEVLETMKEWITTGGGSQDILDDVQLFDSIRSFLDSDADHVVYVSKNFDHPNIRQSWSCLLQLKQGLQSLFNLHVMRPPISRAIPRATANALGATTRNMNARGPPDIDHMSAEDFVESLDGMACAAFSNVTEEVRVYLMHLRRFSHDYHRICMWLQISWRFRHPIVRVGSLQESLVLPKKLLRSKRYIPTFKRSNHRQ